MHMGEAMRVHGKAAGKMTEQTVSDMLAMDAATFVSFQQSGRLEGPEGAVMDLAKAANGCVRSAHMSAPRDCLTDRVRERRDVRLLF